MKKNDLVDLALTGSTYLGSIALGYVALKEFYTGDFDWNNNHVRVGYMMGVLAFGLRPAFDYFARKVDKQKKL